MTVFVGDDWASDHHDVVIHDQDGRRLAKARLPEGAQGMARLHEMVAEHLDDDGDRDPETGFLREGAVLVAIETDRGTWVQALVAAGYTVYAVNPVQAAAYRRRHTSSGAKSDVGDAGVLAEIVRVDAAHHRPLAGDSAQVEGLKLVARAHQSLVWDRTRAIQRLGAGLKEYFPAALEAFAAAGLALADGDALELLAKAADPDAAARLTRSQVTKALARARRRDVETKAEKIRAVLGAPALRQPAEVQRAYAAITRSQVRLLASLVEQVRELEEVVRESFGAHPDAEVYLSVPGVGPVLGARLLGEFGDDRHRYASAKARKNYAGTSPVTIASGKKSAVLARYVRNRRLADAVHAWAFSSLSSSPGARAYYDTVRARGKSHGAALRQLGNRWVGILHGCLRRDTPYDEHTAWPAPDPQADPTSTSTTTELIAAAA